MAKAIPSLTCLRSAFYHIQPVLSRDPRLYPVRSMPVVTLPLVVSARRYGKARQKKQGHAITLSESELEILDPEFVKERMAEPLETLNGIYTDTINVKLTPKMISNVGVSVGGKVVPLKDLGQVVCDSRNLTINMSYRPERVKDAVNALQTKINIFPLVEGDYIKAKIPKPTKELREHLADEAKIFADEAKRSIRKIRDTMIKTVKKEKAISKDSIKRMEDYIDNASRKHIDDVDKMLKLKTNEVMNE